MRSSVTGCQPLTFPGDTRLTRDELRVKIEAARLPLITDRKLGKVTPEWVKRLAVRDV